MMRPVLSVVMPVHNVEAYLPECLETVLSQSLRRLEVIAVDDGSTDGSLAVLREFERRDGRVRVFTQANSGQGIARNRGVEHARGEFLAFIDSDDTIPPDSLSHMVATLRASGSDFCVGSVRRLRDGRFTRTSWQRTVHQADRIGTTLEESPAAMQDIICANRMFRTEFWRQRVGGFRGHIAYEDHVPMLMAYVRAKKFDILSRVTYNWRIREDNTSTGQQKASIQNLRDRIAVKDEAHQFLKAEASDFVRELWVARCLEVDLPPYAARGLEANDEYRALLQATYRTFCDRATDRAWDLVRVFPKIRAHLVADGRWQDEDDATDYFLSVHQVPPTRVVDGRLVADLPAGRPFARDLPAHLLRMAPLEAHFEGVVQKVRWGEEAVSLTGWMRHRSMDVTASAALHLSLRAGDRVVPLELERTTVPEANLWAPLPHAGCALGGFRTEVPFASLTGAESWQLHGRLVVGEISSEGSFHNRIAGSSGDQPGAGPTAAARWDPVLGFVLELKPAPARKRGRRLAVHDISLVDREIRLRVRNARRETLEHATLGNTRLTLPLIGVEADSKGHLLRFDTRVSEFRAETAPAPCGDYELRLGHEFAVVDDDLAGLLPLRLRGDALTVEVTLGRDRDLRVCVVPPLDDDELGMYHQVRLQSAYRRTAAPLTDTVLLSSDLGATCADSQLAIDRHLAANRPEVARVWAVNDWSVAVPDGAQGVLMGSTEWYEMATTSRWVCSNTNLGPWFQVRPGQAYLQTLSGHPSVAMGRGLWLSKGMPPGRVRHLARSARDEWDLLLAPSEAAAECYREQYAYTGPVLIAGSPRTDAVLTTEASQLRQDVLVRLGVPTDQTVILHAPADRDAVTKDSRTGQRYDGLDLIELSTRLGRGYTLLLRRPPGHAAVRGLPQSIVDVTHYPRVNDLILASDVAVLDYSSLRFDWALTGKPMLFFVPDLESYVAARPPVMPFAETSPGPCVRTISELVSHVRRHPELSKAYADALCQFNDRFNALNDGRVTGTVLETFLDPAMPWRTA